MYQNLFDSHTHSENSPDGRHSVTFMVETAIERGFHGLAITDRCECDALAEDGFAVRLRQAALDIAMAREAFRNQIILTTCVELGQPGFDPVGAAKTLALGRFDFILLSLHRLRGHQHFYAMNFSNSSPEHIHAMMLQYFEELLGLIPAIDFDVLAHLTLPARYPRRWGIDLDPTRYAEPIDAVLRALVQGGKGLELNGADLLTEYGCALSPAWVLRRFRELGGKLVTVGSDAHRAGEIGRGVNEGMQLLTQAGYGHFAFYRGRQPVMLRIL